MSYLIDSHCHIHDRSVYDFALSRQKKQTITDFTTQKILKHMKENGVKYAICIGTTHKDSLIARDFAAQHNNIFWSYGIHPEEANCETKSYDLEEGRLNAEPGKASVSAITSVATNVMDTIQNKGTKSTHETNEFIFEGRLNAPFVGHAEPGKASVSAITPVATNVMDTIQNKGTKSTHETNEFIFEGRLNAPFVGHAEPGKASVSAITPVATGVMDAVQKRSIQSPTNNNHLVAIGEVGLDYHDDNYNRDAQIRLFEQMLDLATKNALPLIFHVRDAFDDFFAVLKNFHNIKGVVHSFSDSPKNLEKSLTQGFYIGVNGLATFADIPLPPLERTLLETDSPFLAPSPFRGKVNEPSHIKDIASFLTKKYNQSFDQIATITTRNSTTLFNLPST